MLYSLMPSNWNSKGIERKELRFTAEQGADYDRDNHLPRVAL